ncbi:MSHA biogenesis protein MshK [Vibrio cincinnatiensis]|uniref:MSHA biogenesis protein MshK n=1 Tax=Vibrio cincinnatiensis TaxID=675 RepID=UPI001EDE07AE|nr:MSHA biogenesis protein MshK [Vibrio cincinnatiensis]MCG3730090.1 MSHA biogenesis protein MshK [Vibrio cincinnatiensis]
MLLLLSHSALATQDPTAPLGWRTPSTTKVRQAPLPQLQSIVCQQQCYAILNDQVVSVGSTIQGYRVSQVTESDVTLIRGKQSWELQLFSLDIKN